MNVITVEANEALSTYQEFYVIDSKGNRHDYTFHQESPNLYIGRIRFNTTPFGILSLYARVRDEVDNISDVAVTAIELKEDFQLLKMEVSHREREIENFHRPYSTQLVHDRKYTEIHEGHKINQTKEKHYTTKIDEKHDDADLEE